MKPLASTMPIPLTLTTANMLITIAQLMTFSCAKNSYKLGSSHDKFHNILNTTDLEALGGAFMLIFGTLWGELKQI